MGARVRVGVAVMKAVRKKACSVHLLAALLSLYFERPLLDITNLPRHLRQLHP